MDGVLARPGVRFSVPWVIACVVALFLGAGLADAAEPVGGPITLTVTNAQQTAIVSGATAAAAGVTCVATNGAGCAVAGAVSSFVTPLIAGEVACPKDGVRRIGLQQITQPPTMSNPEGTTFRVISNACGPA